MKRSGWLFTVLIVIGFFFFQHNSVPNLPIPPRYTESGNTIHIPVTANAPTDNKEHWALARRSDGQYFVNVYNNYKLVHKFTAGKKIGVSTSGPGSSGEDFGVTGQVSFEGLTYQATRLHVNSDNRSGYIELRNMKKGNSVTTSNQTQGG